MKNLFAGFIALILVFSAIYFIAGLDQDSVDSIFDRLLNQEAISRF